jgi:hypothetical protein
VLSVKPGGFIPGALLRVVVIGGGFQFAVAARARSQGQYAWPVSVGCLVPLLGVVVLVALAIGGWVMMLFGAEK